MREPALVAIEAFLRLGVRVGGALSLFDCSHLPEETIAVTTAHEVDIDYTGT